MSAWLIDTNLLLRIADTDCELHELASHSLAELTARKEMLFVSGQTFYELWVTATRPVDKRGLGWTEEAAGELLDKVEKRFLRLEDPAGMLKEWLRIVQTHHITGLKAHDMRLVAYARLHRIPRIFTFNTDDFKAVSSEITVVHPRDYLANPEAF